MSGESERFEEWTDKRPRVVFNMAQTGEFEVITDFPCDVYVVNDHCPHDRVYRLTESHMVSSAAVDAALKDDEVGHSGDARHEAAKHRILSAEAGEPHLKPVKGRRLCRCSRST